ncbi:hypothetical protein BST61_g4226 [Cercospora zeina]
MMRGRQCSRTVRQAVDTRAQMRDEAKRSFAQSPFSLNNFVGLRDKMLLASFDNQGFRTHSPDQQSFTMKYTTAVAFALSISGALAAPTRRADDDGTKPDIQTCACYRVLGSCQTGQDPKSYCSSQFTACSGVQPYDGTGKTTSVDASDYFKNLGVNCPAPNTGFPPSQRECNCNAALKTCSTAPNANQAQCSSDFTSCSGVQPFEGTGKTTEVSPTDYFNYLDKQCPEPSPAPSPTPSAPATPAPSKPSDKECQCNAALSACQYAPNANQAQCSSDFSSCSGVQPYEGSGKTTSVSTADYFNNLNKNCPAPSPAPTASATPAPSKPSDKECQCNAALSACQVAPNANQAQCSSDFSSCSGVQPYEGSGKTTSVSTADYFNNLNKNCPAPSPAPTASATPAPSKPSDKECQCYAALSACQYAPNANQAQCGSNYVSCSGVQPYEGTGKTISGSTTDYFNNLNTNCPAAPAPTPAPAPAPAAPADKNYGSYGTYDKYPTHYASYGKYEYNSYKNYGSYKL